MRAVRLPWWVSLPLALVVLVALLAAAGRLNLIPGLPNPFESDTKDRTGPTLLTSIQDMSRYQAASGNFQVVVDLEKDAKYLPDALLGERTLFVGAGSVGAYVDLGDVDKKAVKVNDARTSATLTLPRAELEKPALNEDRSYVVARERGLFDRYGDWFSDNPNSEQKVRQTAVKHITQAAEDSGLRKRAEKNTTQMLEQLLRSLGYERVDVTYA
ncbi:DUF4230 domain-containing protein [Streptomyces sp. RKND-216]|uniref:DUF4230 domain-containing protein n=1 Tax=Streptomyces hazeniae TaxID=3075538 RepID=A0ABU2NP03_9ACTN|nr:MULTISPECIES: DUF4230 domain-containing protein [unclassified Streptomyces]MDT0378484.1 DUF4230 domain-containing protein [Streptomyces sp. DSM 42041]THA25826.1 DUF4230 domain-containing protein [Streptomyces sp. RKND-216]